MRSTLTIILLIFLSTYTFSGEKEEFSTITVTAEGKVEVTPDICYIKFLVKEQGNTLQEAQKKVKEKLSKVLKSIESSDYIKDKNEDVKISPSMAVPYTLSEITPIDTFSASTKKPEITATELTVIIRDPDIPELKKVWDVINIVLQAGGEVKYTSSTYYPYSLGEVLPQYFTLSLENKNKAEQEAIVQAIKEAKFKAEVLAEEFGMKLGEMKTVSVDFPQNNNKNISLNYSTKIQKDIGKIEISAFVTATFNCYK